MEESAWRLFNNGWISSSLRIHLLFVPIHRDRADNCHSCPPRELIPQVKSPQLRSLLSETAQHECTMPPGAFSLASQSSSSDIMASLAIQGRHASIISAASRIPLVRTKLAQPLPRGFTWARVSRLPQHRSPRHHLGTCHFGPESKGEWNFAVEFRGSAVTAKENGAGSLSRQEAPSSIGWPSQCPEHAETWPSPDSPSLLPDNITFASRARREEAWN